jgi:hypothetical protein
VDRGRRPKNCVSERLPHSDPCSPYRYLSWFAARSLGSFSHSARGTEAVMRPICLRSALRAASFGARFARMLSKCDQCERRIRGTHEFSLNQASPAQPAVQPERPTASPLGFHSASRSGARSPGPLGPVGRNFASFVNAWALACRIRLLGARAESVCVTFPPALSRHRVRARKPSPPPTGHVTQAVGSWSCRCSWCRVSDARL